MRLVHRSTTGRLPTSTFDLVDGEGQVLGYCQIRHRASHNPGLPRGAENHIAYAIDEAHRGRGHGKAILALALIEAKRIGLAKVRLTVAAQSPASKRIIESNGGRWVAEFPVEDMSLVHLYEISLD